MTESSNNEVKSDLLETVIEVIQGQKGQSTNEIVSLLALSNLLGIISFLHSSDLNLGTNSSSIGNTPDLKDMASSLLGALGGSGDKKVNPAMLMNLLKTLTPNDKPVPVDKKPEEITKIDDDKKN